MNDEDLPIKPAPKEVRRRKCHACVALDRAQKQLDKEHKHDRELKIPIDAGVHLYWAVPRPDDE